MTIANGNLIIPSDVASLADAASTLASDGVLPGFWYLPVSFQGLVASTPEYLRRYRFVCPCDVLLENITVSTGAQTVSTQCTVTVVSDGGSLADYPAQVGPGSTGTTLSRLARVVFDNTPTNLRDAATTTARVGRTIGKGQTIDILIVTTSVAVASCINVGLFGRQFLSRS